MDFIVEDGTGIDDANSYCSVEDADAYNLTHVDGRAWLEITPLERKEALLIQATRMLNERSTWRGYPLTETQALAFPGVGYWDRYGRPMATDIVPQDVINATAELARFIGTGQYRTGEERIPQSVTLGNASVSYGTVGGRGAGFEQVIPNPVRAMIEYLLIHEARVIRA